MDLERSKAVIGTVVSCLLLLSSCATLEPGDSEPPNPLRTEKISPAGHWTPPAPPQEMPATSSVPASPGPVPPVGSAMPEGAVIPANGAGFVSSRLEAIPTQVPVSPSLVPASFLEAVDPGTAIRAGNTPNPAAPARPVANGPVAGSPIAPAADPLLEITIAEVLQAALQNHPLLHVREHEVEAARARLITARLLPNPELVLDAVESPQVAESQIAARVMFTIPIGPKRRLRSAAAECDIRGSQMALSQETKRVLMEAADAAIEVIYYQELAAQLGQLATLSSRVLKSQQERFKIAATPYRAVVLAEITANNFELARYRTAARLDQARARLALAVALPDETIPPMQGQVAAETVSLPPLCSLLARAREVAPELARSQAAFQESQQQLALERWKAVPDVKLGPRMRESWGPQGEEETFGGRLAVDIPIFDRNQGRIAESAALMRSNCARWEAAEITTLGDVTALYAELQDVQSRWDYYGTKVRPLIQRTEAAMREAFEDRAVTDYELAQLLQSLAEMRLADLDLRYQHQRLRTRLEILLECRLAGLSNPPRTPPAETIPVPPGMSSVRGEK